MGTSGEYRELFAHLPATLTSETPYHLKCCLRLVYINGEAIELTTLPDNMCQHVVVTSTTKSTHAMAQLTSDRGGSLIQNIGPIRVERSRSKNTGPGSPGTHSTLTWSINAALERLVFTVPRNHLESEVAPGESENTYLLKIQNDQASSHCHSLCPFSWN